MRISGSPPAMTIQRTPGAPLEAIGQFSGMSRQITFRDCGHRRKSFAPVRCFSIQWPSVMTHLLASETIVIRDLEYARHATGPLLLDLHLPAHPVAPPPVVVWLHGGGWRRGDRSFAPDLDRYFAARGYAMANVEYRLSGEALFPAQLEDVRAAVRWLRDYAERIRLRRALDRALGFVRRRPPRRAGGHHRDRRPRSRAGGRRRLRADRLHARGRAVAARGNAARARRLTRERVARRAARRGGSGAAARRQPDRPHHAPRRRRS